MYFLLQSVRYQNYYTMTYRYTQSCSHLSQREDKSGALHFVRDSCVLVVQQIYKPRACARPRDTKIVTRCFARAQPFSLAIARINAAINTDLAREYHARDTIIQRARICRYSPPRGERKVMMIEHLWQREYFTRAHARLLLYG